VLFVEVSFQVRGNAIPKAAEIEVEGWPTKRRKYSLLLETGYPTQLSVRVKIISSSGQYFMPVCLMPQNQ
jgi:hypothetical protein